MCVLVLSLILYHKVVPSIFLFLFFRGKIYASVMWIVHSQLISSVFLPGVPGSVDGDVALVKLDDSYVLVSDFFYFLFDLIL